MNDADKKAAAEAKAAGDAAAKEAEAKAVAKREAEEAEKRKAEEAARIAADPVLPGEKTVKMKFIKKVRVGLEGHKYIDFLPGVQEVPVSLKDHWYLKAHGVEEV